MRMKKNIFIVCVILAICFASFGALLKHKSNIYKGTNVMFGYNENGQTVINKRDSGTIGGDSEKQEEYSSMSNMCFVLSGVSVVVGIYCRVSKKKEGQ